MRNRQISSGVLIILLLLSLFLILGCQDDDGDSESIDDNPTDIPSDEDDDDAADDDDDDAFRFPEGFLFGTATAGFQVDMGCPSLPADQCDDVNSDWYQYVTSDETVLSGRTFLSGENPSVIGPGHWELYESDFDLAKDELSNNAFRMSIEWSRIFPESTVGIDGYEALSAAADQETVQHYHDVFAALAEREMQPFVTLHHYTMPTWLHDGVECTLNPDTCTERGWLDPERAVEEISKYAGFVAAEFGEEVDLWATQNEPLAVLMPGYLLPSPERSNPPATFFQFADFKTAYEAMIVAHARMYDEVKANDAGDADNDGSNSLVGLVYAMAPVRPINPASAVDMQAAENVFYLWNLAFLDAVALGMFDAELDGNQVLRDDLAGRMDYIGINYKVRIAVEGIPFSFLPGFSPLFIFNPLTLIMDEIHTEGIYEMAMIVRDRYGLPSIVTENNGQSIYRGDMEGENRYLVEHLTWLAKAIGDGADVRGYFYWSLTDNYEWNRGSGKPLGFYEIDPEDSSKERIPRITVQTYRAICEYGGIPAELADKYPTKRD